MGLRKFGLISKSRLKVFVTGLKILFLGYFASRCLKLLLSLVYIIFKCVIIFPQDDKSTVFLIAAYARYSCPYVWVSVSYNHCTSDVYGALFSLNPRHSLACWVT